MRYYQKKVFRIRVIAPTKEQVAMVGATLAYLRYLDTREFQNVNRLIGTIFITPFDNFYNEFFLKDNIWFVDKDFIDETKNVVSYFISLMVHEATHRKRYLAAGSRRSGFATDREERAAYQAQISFLVRHGFRKGAGAAMKKMKRRVWRSDDPHRRLDKKYQKLLHLYKSGALKIIAA